MAHPSDHRSFSRGTVRFVLVLVGLFLVVYMVRPPTLRHYKALSSCPPCLCDCEEDSMFSPIGVQTVDLKLDLSGNSRGLSEFAENWCRHLKQLIGRSFCDADCGKDDPQMNEEMKKDIASLLAEEINLQKNVTDDILERTKALIMSAKRASSHYQKESEKCNIGIDTCEGGREKAEAALIEERKLSALWETRAIEFGWKD
ncbi:putative 39S ribosomal protein L45, mitochondrial-like [Capsicum annuum]|nr:putative 39S ribosomal protein L45, mitochondrial-like [Capsicum annuum]